MTSRATRRDETNGLAAERDGAGRDERRRARARLGTPGAERHDSR
jgi:hypothetical protein